MASITIYSGIDEELPKDSVLSRRKCCFWMPCMHCHRLTFSARSNWEDDRLLPFKKIKEWSQRVVIPKLKSFIRQFSTRRHGKLNYDHTSYMLNFDEGLGYFEDDDQANRKFSTRYSSILIPGKPVMMLGEHKPAKGLQIEMKWAWVDMPVNS